jgi:hypothetical protein
MAGYPAAAGTPTYIGTMIPEIWSGQLLAKFYAATCLSEIANTDFEGEIKAQGDRVHIRTTPDILIKDHKKGQKLETQAPEPSVVDLIIDNGKYWQFVSDDVTRLQADYNYIDNWTSDAGKQLRIAVERSVFASAYASAAAANKGATAGADSVDINLGVTGTPLQWTSTDVISNLVNIGTVLDEQNAPDSDRFVILPPWAVAMLKKSDLKDASLTGDPSSILRRPDGRVGQVDRLTVYSSRLLSTVVDTGHKCFNAMFGHKSGLSFASQLLMSEGPMRSPEYFGDLFRGLQVYGFNVNKPDMFGHLYIYK